MSEAPPIRIHVLLRSTEPNLQNERSLFEINSNTSVKELKQAIIQRLDDRQVTRTFYEQVVLSFREEVFPNDPGSDELTVPSLLQLTNDDIREMNNVIPVNLQIKSSVNGILSREFWQDLTADDRFDFLPIINQEAERTQNEDTIPPDMAMVDPMKIVVGDDRVWHLTGTSYESISNGQGSNKLVNQDGISLKVYEISSASNEHEKVVLNTSHCIIVDNGQHQPYMLLSPAGIAKVDSVFKLQKVKVVLHNLTNTAQTPAPAQEQGAQVQVEDDVLARVVTAGKRLLMLTFQIALVLLMLGYKPNKHMQENWIKYLILIIVLFNIYILFFTGENRVQRLAENDIDLANQPPATQNFIHIVRRLARARENVAGIVVGVQDELVTIVASRTWDFEYIMSKEPNWYFVIASNFENIWKDALIYVLSILPTFQVKLYDELHKQKQMELKVFEDKVRLFYDLVLLLIQEYNKEYTPQFILPHNVALEPVLEILETLREDEKFEFLVKYYKCMKSIYDVFNKAYVKHKSLTNEQIDFLNGFHKQMVRLTDESRAFHYGVYSIVYQIPPGKITTYGHIAYLLDKPGNARQVGSSLKHCTMIIQGLNRGFDPSEEEYLNIDSLPWWRVLLSSGKISPRENSQGQYLQADRLREEQIPVSQAHLVDLEEYGWFPEDVNL